jgi:hypothetical protein
MGNINVIPIAEKIGIAHRPLGANSLALLLEKSLNLGIMPCWHTLNPIHPHHIGLIGYYLVCLVHIMAQY